MATDPKKRKSDEVEAPKIGIKSISNATMPFLWFFFAVIGLSSRTRRTNEN